MVEQVLDRALDRWVDAGIIDPTQAEAIRAHEADDADTSSAPAEPPPPPPAAPPAPESAPSTGSGSSVVFAEALAYVGAALALGAGALVLGDVWDGLSEIGRAVTITLVALFIGGAARALWAETEGAGRRLAGVLAAGSAVAVAASVGLWHVALFDVTESGTALLAGLAALAVAVPVHRLRPAWPTTLVLGAGVLITVFAGIDLSAYDISQIVSGVVLAGIGLAWAAAGWSGLTRPRAAFEVTGLLAGGVGCQVLATTEWTTWIGIGLALVVSLAAVTIGVSEQRTAPTVIGGLGVVAFAPQAVLEAFGEAIGGPLALLVTGVLLVVMAVLALRTHREAES